MSTPHAPRQTTTPQTLRIIRFVLFLGPLVVGAVFAVLTMQNGPFLEGDPGLARTLRLAFLGVAAAAAVSVALVRRLCLGATTYHRRASLSIAGWAVAEMVAIFGAVYLLLFGSGLVFLVGLILLGLTWLALPLPAQS